MSKKKAGGNTMTLKDFHGGSIPSDLPLPSAPGTVPRSADRTGSDRASMGNSLGRPDHRARPNSSPSIRTFDDKSPFLTHLAHIERNFDEDERKPLDLHSAPRRMVSYDSLRLPNSRTDVKLEPVSTGRETGVLGSAPYSAQLGNSTQIVGFKSENSIRGGSHNAWGLKKEISVVGQESVPWSGQTAVSKFVNASAVDKVSSGRWQSKVSLPNQTDIEVIKHFEPEIMRSKNYDNTLTRGRESSDGILARLVESGLSVKDGISGWRNCPADYEKSHGMASLEVKEMKPATNSNIFQNVHSDGILPSPVMQPRMKAVENVERPAIDLKQSGATIIGHPGTGSVLNLTKPGLPSGESLNQPVERPKLNLKPRSQPLEQSVGRFEKERAAVFGGARPRELVLKERGTDDTKSQEPVQHSNRPVQKPERVPSRQGERSENLSRDVKTTKKLEKKDNWRDGDNKRHPSPETWRKSVEPPKPVTPDGSGLRFGKVASAMELAQAFSKPCSAPKGDNRMAGPRGAVPGRPQVPFSRLTSPAPRQIDGY